MFLRLLKRLPLKAALSAVTLLGPFALSAQGQYQYVPQGASNYYYPYQSCMPAAPPAYGMMFPGSAAMCPPGGMPYGAMPPLPYQPYFPPPHPCLPVPPSAEQPAQPGQPTPPAQPGQPTQPGDLTRPSETPGQGDLQSPNPFDMNAANTGQEPTLPGEQGAAGGGSSVAMAAPGGYLDNPIPISTFRLRFDAVWGVNHPDRAEYIYGAWQELGFHPHGIQGHGVFFDPRAIGPDLLARRVTYQVPEAYFEFAPLPRFSAFVQVPYRIIQFHDLLEDNPESETKTNPAAAPNAGSKFFPEPGPENSAPKTTGFNGISDMQFGFKYAVLASPTQFLTTQLRLYSPSGDPGLGLGTGHWSLEPSLLYFKRWNRLVLQGQLTDWIPIDGGEAGNIIQYGAGLGYAVYQRGNIAIMPITEFLGWTVLNGYEATFGTISATAPPGLELPVTHGVLEAGGNTIVNGKWGIRAFFGNGSSLFVGYGRALTGTHWYTDDFRVEYRLFFGRNNRALNQPRPL
jgi:hypothetical protein